MINLKMPSLSFSFLIESLFIISSQTVNFSNHSIQSQTWLLLSQRQHDAQEKKLKERDRMGKGGT